MYKGISAYFFWMVFKNMSIFLSTFLAVQDSSIGDSVSEWVSEWVTLFSCPGQLNKWHGLSLGANLQSEPREHQRVTLDTSRH